MAVLDIVSFSLIDPRLALEDTTTAAGRVWNALLQSIQEKEGYLSESWGRLVPFPGDVVLFVVWVDKESRDRFYTEGLGITAIEYLLKYPATFRYLLNGELDKLLKPEVLNILIKSLPRSYSDPLWQAPIKQEEYKLLESSSTVALPLGGELYELDVAEAGKVPDTLQLAIVMALPSRILGNEITTVFDDNASILGIRTETVQLHKKFSIPPISASSSNSTSRISQLFSRDASYFSRSLLSLANPVAGVQGPRLSWRSPLASYQIGNSCFSDRVAAPPPSMRYFHMFPPKVSTYMETISLVFKTSEPEPQDDKTESGIAWRSYRKQLLSQKKCLKLFLLKSHATPYNIDMVVEWDTACDSKACHTSSKTIAARDALLSHLTAESQLTPSPSVFFNPDHDREWAEIVDFVMAPKASQAERRAAEYYIWNFNQTMETFESFITPTVSAKNLGWIGGSPSKPTYRVLYDWKSPREETQWVTEFLKAPYALTGYRAHWVALAVDSVVGMHISLRQERLEDLVDPSEGDQDLGF